MTNEDAIEFIKTEISRLWDTPQCRLYKEAFEMAIKALEQEPILDKIRAEIKALSNSNPSYWHSGDMVDRDDVLEIIDKYKAETE